ncbi:hypothetical protein F5B20DRAFT_578329 [Whalleya microplaca]|nr:hypothetical protein F5B20DRAFT_578329 [Whalleya microplaca]
MCEFHYQQCINCKKTWTARQKLDSCDSEDEDAKCPEYLCIDAREPKRQDEDDKKSAAPPVGGHQDNGTQNGGR